MAAVTICSDFGAPKNKVSHCFHCFLMKSAIVEVFTPQCYESEPFFFFNRTSCWAFISMPLLTSRCSLLLLYIWYSGRDTPPVIRGSPPPTTFDNPLISSSGVFSLSFHTNSSSTFKLALNLCCPTLKPLIRRSYWALEMWPVQTLMCRRHTRFRRFSMNTRI